MKTIALALFKSTIKQLLLEAVEEADKQIGANKDQWKVKVIELINQKLG
jgi:hypothetical protein